jgi:hypothetical protein
MSYTESFIRAHGDECVIKRTPEVASYVSIKPATQSYSDNRDLYREGLVLATSELKPGEVMEVDSEILLIRSVYPDKQSGQLSFLASKANATLTQSRFEETTDEWGNVTQEWKTITDSVYSTAQIVSAALRQQDPGLLPTTKWVFLVPSTLPLQELDRLQFKPDGDKCRVDSIDDIRLPGLLRVQCSDDRR